MATLKGIDVSQFQGQIDWNKVKASGIQFAIIRAGYGQGNIDPKFHYNISECNRLGIPCGVYWFSYAYTMEMAVKEANYLIAALRPYKVTWPVFYDFEYDSIKYAKKCGVTVSASLASNMAVSFLEAVRSAGYTPGLYAGTEFANNYFTSAAVRKYPLWFPQYGGTKMKYSGPMTVCMWQYTDSGRVNGISGNVDMSHGYVNYAEAAAPVKWYDKSGEWAEAKKIGITDGTNPDGNATRAQAAAMILRARKDK